MFDETYVTIVGSGLNLFSRPFEVGELVKLVKDPDNARNPESIAVELPHCGIAGYVANSPRMMAGGTRSAARIYDSFGESCYARVMFCTAIKAIARVEPYAAARGVRAAEKARNIFEE